MARVLEQPTEGLSLERTALYRDTDGDLVTFDETNKHHAFWECDWYRGGFERGFRNVHAWYFRLKVPVHADLHAALNPPMKPTQKMMHELMDVAEDVQDRSQLAQFQAVIEHLDEAAGKTYNTAHAKLAGRLCANLVDQQPFIWEGIVQPVHIGRVAC